LKNNVEQLGEVHVGYRSTVGAFVEAMRIPHWVKNAFVIQQSFYHIKRPLAIQLFAE